jgi:hypothetical protein
MLKLNSSYSKKVPAEQEYSSKSFHASVEVELPDGLTPEQLQDRIHCTFELVRNAVESEINGTAGKVADTIPAPVTSNNAPPKKEREQSKAEPASNKQIRYLLDLARRQDIGSDKLSSIAGERFGVDSVYSLGKQQCSTLIDSIRSLQKAA